MTKPGKIIGIDLGTTNSCVSVLVNGKPVVIPNAEGGRTTPSMVGLRKGEWLVGQLAKRQAIMNAKDTIFSIKRFIGRRWHDTESERSRVSYTCVPGKDQTVNVRVGDRAFTPQEMSAMILRKLREDAEKYLGESVNQAVITIPAYFSDAQRQATKDAGRIAGLEVQRIINEPTAAALAYGLDNLEQEECILVFDLGGGTFDISILRLGESMLEVVATAGDNHLGGDDFDNGVMQWLLDTFREEEGIDLSDDVMALQRIREAAERAKIELSTAMVAPINLPFLTKDGPDPKNLELDLTRARFDELTRPLIGRTIELVTRALEDANLKTDDIDRILLIGGSTRIPAVQSALQKYFNGKALDCSMNPDEAVAQGAAVQGAILSKELDHSRNLPVPIDVTPMSLGIELLGGIFNVLIERNTTIPTSYSRVFTTSADGQTSVDVHILQGESKLVKNNISLGRLELDGIPPAPRGVAQIEVTFELDVNCILTVSARDVGTQRERRISLSNNGKLSPREFQEIVERWEREKETEQQRVEIIRLKNEADQRLADWRKTVRLYGGRIPSELQAEVDQMARELERAIACPDMTLTALQERYKALEQLSLSAGKHLYTDCGETDCGETDYRGITDSRETDYSSVVKNPFSSTILRNGNGINGATDSGMEGRRLGDIDNDATTVFDPTADIDIPDYERIE